MVAAASAARAGGMRMHDVVMTISRKTKLQKIRKTVCAGFAHVNENLERHGTTARDPHSCSWRSHSHRIHVISLSM
jgi:hypothetical protein